MSWIATGISAAVGLYGAYQGGKDQKVKQEVDPWTKDNIDEWEGYYKNSPIPQYDLDNLTADLNPWQIESLSDIANYAGGAGQDQVDMMNLMGLNQAGVGDSLQALAGMQAGLGGKYATGGGDWIMNQLAAIGNGDFSSVLGTGGGGGGGYGGGDSSGGFQAGPVDHLKFEYDQGTYDQIMGNLKGLAQGSFDAYSDQTKTDSLFNNGAGIQMGQALLGGANSKVGQGSALLDAMTNQDIINYGAQMNQWAGDRANQGAMTSGQSTLQAQTGAYQSQTSAAAQIASANISAAASRASSAMAAKANMYNSAMTGASNMMGYGVGMMGDASNSLNNASGAYGAAGDTFGNANTTSLANLDASASAGNYLNQYDQAALDRYNTAHIYNQGAAGDYALAGLNAMSGVPYGKTTTTPGLNTAQQVGTAIGVGNSVYGLINQLPIFNGSSGGGGGGIPTNIGMSDIRLKKNIEFVGKKGDINIYKWDWNDVAESIGADIYPRVGVIAQEMLAVRPDVVVQDDPSGYLKINYGALNL